MALANNQRLQMAQKLQADLKISMGLVIQMQDDNGNPAMVGSDVAFEIRQRQYNGFQMLAELSSSSAQGLPEHELWFVANNDLTLDAMAKYSKLAFSVGASSVKLVLSDAPALEDMIDANVVAEIPNDIRLGAVGQ